MSRPLAGLGRRNLAVSRIRPPVRRRFERFGLLEGVRVFATNREALAAASLTRHDDEETATA